MDNLDSALVTLVAHGQTDALLKSGFKSEWIDSNDAKVVFRAAVEMLHRTPIIFPNRINLLAASWGELKDAGEVKKLISLNGTGEAPADVVAGKMYNRFLSKEAQTLEKELHNLLSTKPHEAQNYLPLFAQRLENLAATGRVYNPTPSAHKGSIVAPVLFRSKYNTINKLFEGRMEDGGGWRAGHWCVILGITGHGKSTFGFTSAVDAISQKQVVAFVCKEKQSSVRARILLGLTGLTIKEVETEIAVDQEPIYDSNGNVYMIRNREGEEVGPWHERSVRQKVFDQQSAKADQYMFIYDWTFSKINTVKSIISAIKPSILNIDYIDVNDVAGNDKVSGLGKIAKDYEDTAHNTGTHINGYFQISNSEKVAYEKNDHHEIPGPYSSGMVMHTADTAFQTKKGRVANTQHILRTKCRAGGANDEFPMDYDTKRWIYKDRVVPNSY
jgi:hypothetical protein